MNVFDAACYIQIIEVKGGIFMVSVWSVPKCVNVQEVIDELSSMNYEPILGNDMYLYLCDRSALFAKIKWSLKAVN